ncbi:MAG: GTPase Era [Clostridiales bacterium]|nr:GTPase Era [Clostridiales bacterium]
MHFKIKGDVMDQKFKSGFVAVIGRSNVGKSTLLNTLVGEKIAIVSDKPQTTRNRIHCVLTREHYQIVFIDTPGIHRAKNKLSEYMVKTATSTLDEVDVIVLVLDIADGIGAGDRNIIEMLQDVQTPVIVALNKADRLSSEELSKRIEKFRTEFNNLDNYVAVSALLGTNLDQLEGEILEHLDEGPKYYPDDMITDQPERVIIAELIREKALELLREEIPHGIGVEITSIRERKDQPLIDIYATIYVEKKSHKGIVIGKRGQMLKQIGQRARKDIENLLGTKVYLELWVKVTEDWRNSIIALRNLGYDDRN